jgi:hypothetical protein
MFEMSYAREYHRQSMLVGGSNHVRVAHGTSGLNYGSDSMFSCFVDSVSEREERIRRQH